MFKKGQRISYRGNPGTVVEAKRVTPGMIDIKLDSENFVRRARAADLGGMARANGGRRSRRNRRRARRNAGVGVGMLVETQRRLQARLRELKDKRPVISAEIEEARLLGDLSENAAYHDARERQGLNEAEIRKIESDLAQARVVDIERLPRSARVVLGAHVALKRPGKRAKKIRIHDGSETLEPKRGDVSLASPWGQSLVGRRVGDTVELPDAKRQLHEWQIVEVRYGSQAPVKLGEALEEAETTEAAYERFTERRTPEGQKAAEKERKRAERKLRLKEQKTSPIRVDVARGRKELVGIQGAVPVTRNDPSRIENGEVCGNPIDGTAYYLMVSTRKRWISRTIRQEDFDNWLENQRTAAEALPREPLAALGNRSLYDLALRAFARARGVAVDDVEYKGDHPKDGNGIFLVQGKWSRVTPIYDRITESYLSPEGSNFEKTVNAFLDEQSQRGGKVIGYPVKGDLLAKSKVRGKVKKQARIELTAAEKRATPKKAPEGAFIHKDEWFMVSGVRGVDAERLKELNPYVRRSYRVPTEMSLAAALERAFGVEPEAAVALVQSGNVRVSRGGRRRMGGPQFDSNLRLRERDQVTVINKEKAKCPFFSFVYEGSSVPDPDKRALCLPRERGGRSAVQALRRVSGALSSVPNLFRDLDDPQLFVDGFRATRTGTRRVKRVAEGRVDSKRVLDQIDRITKAVNEVDAWYQVNKEQGTVPNAANAPLVLLSSKSLPPTGREMVSGVPASGDEPAQPGLATLLKGSDLLADYRNWSGQARRLTEVEQAMMGGGSDPDPFDFLRAPVGRESFDVTWTQNALKAAAREYPEESALFANLALLAGYYYHLGGYRLAGPLNPNAPDVGTLAGAIDRLTRNTGRDEVTFKATGTDLIESIQDGLQSSKGLRRTVTGVERLIRDGFVYVRGKSVQFKDGEIQFLDGKKINLRKGTLITVSMMRRGGGEIYGANYHVYKTYNPILFKMAVADWGDRERRTLKTGLQVSADALIALDKIGSYGATVRMVQEAAFSRGKPKDVNATVAKKMRETLGPAIIAAQGGRAGLIARNPKGQFSEAVLTWSMNWDPITAADWWEALGEDPMTTMQKLKAETKARGVDFYPGFRGGAASRFRAYGDLLSGEGSRKFRSVMAGKDQIGARSAGMKKIARKLQSLRPSSRRRGERGLSRYDSIPKLVTNENFHVAVEAFQKASGLRATGFVDARTLNVLEEALEARAALARPAPIQFQKDEKYHYTESSLEHKTAAVREQYNSLMKRIDSTIRRLERRDG